jgi:hypothetical protein
MYDLCVLASFKAVHQTIAAYVWALLTYYRTPNTSALRLRFFFLLAFSLIFTVFVLLNILSVAPTILTCHCTRRSHLLHHLRGT